MGIDAVELRLFEPDEWPMYKAVRLKALQSDPSVFGSNYGREVVYTDADWRERVENANQGIFGVFHYGDIIGMTGVAVAKDDPSGTTAILWGSWLEKLWRGKGISEKMYQARIGWALAHPAIKRINVAHRQSNIASKQANQKHGFVFTHLAHHTWPDGTDEPEVFYTLLLKR
ncbi:MAG: GNAT family protein [Micavibrio sp.]|nr:GNAT family protein [Micavibrio sp.]